jgi:hypothetical protein
MLTNILPTPFTRINDSVEWSDNINNIVQSTFNTIGHDSVANKLKTHHQFIDIQKSFLYVCTETVFEYPHAYISEKSFKGITAKRPFIILGAPGTLSLLKLYGFKTFNDWWDESYDDEHSVDLRLTKVYNIVKEICNLSVNSLQSLCKEMSPTLEYNFNHYDTFRQQQLQQFETSCINNLRR